MRQYIPLLPEEIAAISGFVEKLEDLVAGAHGSLEVWLRTLCVVSATTEAIRADQELSGRDHAALIVRAFNAREVAISRLAAGKWVRLERA